MTIPPTTSPNRCGLATGDSDASDAVRWLRDDYHPPAGRFDGICYDFNTDTESE